jgi:maltose/moltooligosaccharide transporter
MVKYVYNNQPVYALVMAGIFMLCAAISVIYVYDPGATRMKENNEWQS